MKNILLFKKDLDSYLDSQIYSMVRHFSLPHADPKDFRWLLAIHLSRKHGSMLGKDNYFEMMLFMDLPTLKNMCSTNNEMRAICKHPYFWQRYSAKHKLTQKPAFMEERLKLGQYQNMPTEVIWMVMMSMDPITLSNYVKTHKEAAMIAGQESFKKEYTAKQKSEIKETTTNFYAVDLIEAALYLRYEELAQLFLVGKISVKIGVEVGYIQRAIETNNVKFMELLLKYGANATVSQLLIAVQKNRVEIVELLLKSGMDPRVGLLNNAVKNNNAKLVELLLKYGARANLITFFYANKVNNAELVELLLKYGTKEDIQVGGKNVEIYFLTNVIGDNHMKIAEILLKNGVQPQFIHLDCATKVNHVELVKLLLKYGAQPDIDLLNQAISKNHMKIVKLFLKKGVQPNYHSWELAAESGNTRLIRKLVENYN